MERIDYIAKAAWETPNEDGDSFLVPWEGLTEAGREQWRKVAKSVLDAAQTYDQGETGNA